MVMGRHGVVTRLSTLYGAVFVYFFGGRYARRMAPIVSFDNRFTRLNRRALKGLILIFKIDCHCSSMMV